MGFKHERQPPPDEITSPTPDEMFEEITTPNERHRKVNVNQSQDAFPWNTELIEHFGILENEIRRMRSKKGVWNAQSKQKLDTWIKTINECLGKFKAGTSTLEEEYKRAQLKKILVDQSTFQDQIETQTNRLRRLITDKVDKIGKSNELVEKYDTDILIVTKISGDARQARKGYVKKLQDAISKGGD